MMTGDTCNISHIAEFSFYDWVWYVSPSGKTGHASMRVKRLGRYLGPSHNVGDAMCGSVINEKAEVVERTSIIPLSVEDENNEAIAKMKKIFDEVMKIKLKVKMVDINKGEEVSLYEDAGDPMDPEAQTMAEPFPCLLYTSPSPRDGLLSRMPSSA